MVLPFFSDTEEDKRALMVVIRVATSTVDLYDREREYDSKLVILILFVDHDISDTVLTMMELASQIIDI